MGFGIGAEPKSTMASGPPTRGGYRKGRKVVKQAPGGRSPRRGSAASPRRSPGVRQGSCSFLPLRGQSSERGNLPVSPHPFDRRRLCAFRRRWALGFVPGMDYPTEKAGNPR